MHILHVTVDQECHALILVEAGCRNRLQERRREIMLLILQPLGREFHKDLQRHSHSQRLAGGDIDVEVRHHLLAPRAACFISHLGHA